MINSKRWRKSNELHSYGSKKSMEKQLMFGTDQQKTNYINQNIYKFEGKKKKLEITYKNKKQNKRM